jgi:hypothetical protein
LIYQNLNQNCNILYSEHLIYGLYVCTCVFFLRQESFDMILVNNPSFYDGVLHSTRANYIRTASTDSQNILSPPCESLKIFYFSKYRICGATIYKAQLFFHWIDFKYLYSITNFIQYILSYIHTYTLYQSDDILLQYISQSLNVTNIYYIDDRLIKI